MTAMNPNGIMLDDLATRPQRLPSQRVCQAAPRAPAVASGARAPRRRNFPRLVVHVEHRACLAARAAATSAPCRADGDRRERRRNGRLCSMRCGAPPLPLPEFKWVRPRRRRCPTGGEGPLHPLHTLGEATRSRHRHFSGHPLACGSEIRRPFGCLLRAGAPTVDPAILFVGIIPIVRDTRQAPRIPTLTTCSCLTRASAAFPSLLRRATRTVAPMLVVAALAPLACTRPVCVPPHDQGEGLRKSGRAAKRGWSQKGEILDMLAINTGFYCSDDDDGEPPKGRM